MTQPNYLAPFGPVGRQIEWEASAGMQRAVLGTSTSSSIDALMLATDTNVRYVDPGGVDASSTTGSRVNPFRTVQAAINNCAAFATLGNPFAIRVSPGAGYGSFKLAANIYVIGSGSGSANYNATPSAGVTVLSPNAALSIDSTFAGAGVACSGIIAAALDTAFNADFASIGSTGAKELFISDVLTQSAFAVKGSGNLEYLTAKNLIVNAAVNTTLTDLGGSDLLGFANDFGTELQYVQAAAIQSFHLLCGSTAGRFRATWTSAALANSLGIFGGGNSAPLNTTISGDGAFLQLYTVSNQYSMNDAAVTVGFGNLAGSTYVGISGGVNVLRMTPTANRVLTLGTPVAAVATVVRIRNLATTAGRNIDISFVGTTAPGVPTYVPPSSELELTYAVGQSTWFASPLVQAGSIALTNGVSANIPADITANSRIVATLKTVSGAFGTPVCGGRVVGTRAGGGLFVITSTLPATGATVATDQGTYDWQINNDGG